METGYQRGKIQEESMHYEHKKHDGSYPIFGVNTFLNPHGSGVASEIELARSTDDEKQSQLKRLADFQARNGGEAEACLARLRQAVIDNGDDGRRAPLLAGEEFECPVPGWRAVSAQHVKVMRSGIPWDRAGGTAFSTETLQIER